MNTITTASRHKLLSAKFAAKATIAGLALAASVIAVAPAAQADRPSSPDGTTLGAQCYQIGQDYVDGVAAVKAAHAAGDQAGMDAGWAKIHGAEDQWKDICEGVYGSLYIGHAATRDGETGLGTTPRSPVTAPTAVPRPGQSTQTGIQ
ncbi:hypothetical protein [Mycobacterium sp.]|uniref:hypothetical protein n=1 Tax=Mycobacterium sp. TaxID=1785 RepID=UPI002D10525C|nr:hypothetical protein [Mycobacterium sp.]HKP39600.1 hypothetical protein [Mycobacterium sp.]